VEYFSASPGTGVHVCVWHPRISVTPHWDHNEDKAHWSLLIQHHDFYLSPLSLALSLSLSLALARSLRRARAPLASSYLARYLLQVSHIHRETQLLYSLFVRSGLTLQTFWIGSISIVFVVFIIVCNNNMYIMNNHEGKSARRKVCVLFPALCPFLYPLSLSLSLHMAWDSLPS